MKLPQPTGFKFEPPPKIDIPDSPQIEEESEENVFEIKNPILANLFHYGMMALIILIALFFGRIIGGILGAVGIAAWANSGNQLDKNKGGF